MKRMFQKFTLMIMPMFMVLCCFSFPVLADEMTPLEYKQLTSQRVKEPTPMTMAADVIIARPLGVAATLVGGALFLVSLPFSILGGNVNESFCKLVGVPAKTTFQRCLGCQGEVYPFPT